MKDILEYCRGRRNSLLEAIEVLVRLESPTTDKPAVDRCGVELRRRLEEHGAQVSLLEQTVAGDHLRAEFGDGRDQVLLLGHFDTVWPLGQLARMPLEQRDGRLFGPGVYDMKSGIAQAMLATRALYDTGHAPAHRIVMLWTTDEETGSTTSRAAIEREAKQSAAVLVLEPSTADGSLKTSRKGCGVFRVSVSGVSSHAGVDPGKGASAIHELARQIVDLQRLQNLSRGISVNVGTVVGGSRTNVIADHAEASVDVRVPRLSDALVLEQAIRGLQPADQRTAITVEGGVDRPPMERSAAVAGLFEIAQGVAMELGGSVTEAGTGGGSDGNFTAAAGVPTLDGLGAVGDGAHALHEHVLMDDLPWRAALLAGLMARIPTR